MITTVDDPQILQPWKFARRSIMVPDALHAQLEHLIGLLAQGAPMTVPEMVQHYATYTALL